MALSINTAEELSQLVKKLGLEVKTPQQLAELLAVVRSQSDPEEERRRIIWSVGALAPMIALGAAGVMSFILCADNQGHGLNEMKLGALGIAWGVAALVTGASMIFLGIMLRRPKGETDRWWGPVVNAPGGGPEKPAEPNPLVTRLRELK
jgi:hypothetical protein